MDCLNSPSWQTQRVKRLGVVMIVTVVFAAFIAAFWAFRTRSTRPQAVLPTPNGYDDFAAAAQWTVAWSGDLLTLPPEEIRAAIKQNSKVLELVRRGLKKQSMVPTKNDMNWLHVHMVQMGAHRTMAQLLVAEGIVHLQDGRTNEAARCFADCIVFARAAHHQGLMIDELVSIACQAIGSRQLVQIAPQVSPDVLQEILSELIALDQAREPAAAIVQRDRNWSRGTYGVWRTMWMSIAMSRNTRAMEAGFEKQQAHSVAALRLAATELAVRGYEAKNGKPPKELAELVPAWLPAVPLDPFSNRPLVYRVTTNTFLLYGVGPDGKDDGGKPLK